MKMLCCNVHASMLLLALLIAGRTMAVEAADTPFRITVIDEQSGRGVPLVELTTVNTIRLVTDSAGVIAFDEPGLMGQTVFFHVKSHGYEFPQDGFGIRGVRLTPTAGGEATIRIRRLNIAERLYRVTGGAIYRDSHLLGDPVPISEPVLNGQVLGSDSVQNAVYQGRIYWFWGDTNRPSYPLGNFHVPGATSRLPAAGGLSPKEGVNLTYFVGDDGFARPTCKMAGEGPTWIDGLTVLTDSDGRERMFAAFAKIRPPLTVYRRGIAEWDDEQEQFIERVSFDAEEPRIPQGQVFVHPDESGRSHVYFANPYPDVRVAATPEAFLDLSRYEARSCVRQADGDAAATVIRDAEGRLQFRWSDDGVPLTESLVRQLRQQQLLSGDDGIRTMVDTASGEAVRPHRGSVYWNDYRKQWVMVFTELGGRSHLGEAWYAEAPQPTGPWKWATRIATHDRYSFYNPKQHPMFDEDGGRVIYFEGTYTHTFSGNEDQTPRYDYNQIMYRLDLSDPRLHLE